MSFFRQHQNDDPQGDEDKLDFIFKTFVLWKPVLRKSKASFLPVEVEQLSNKRSLEWIKVKNIHINS